MLPNGFEQGVSPGTAPKKEGISPFLETQRGLLPACDQTSIPGHRDIYIVTRNGMQDLFSSFLDA
jgi:hypothetical protein